MPEFSKSSPKYLIFVLKFASFLFYTGAGLFYLAHRIQQLIPKLRILTFLEIFRRSHSKIGQRNCENSYFVFGVFRNPMSYTYFEKYIELTDFRTLGERQTHTY